MEQSMSRVGCCIDNGPTEGFSGIIKTEMYQMYEITNEESLRFALTDYIRFYSEERPHILYGRSSAPHFRYLTCLLDRGHIRQVKIHRSCPRWLNYLPLRRKILFSIGYNRKVHFNNKLFFFYFCFNLSIHPTNQLLCNR